MADMAAKSASVQPPEETAKICEAVRITVVCMPTELCGVISEYAARGPHTWNARGLAPSMKNDPPTAIGRDHAFELKVSDPTCNSWYKFVSERSFESMDGHLEWSVEWKPNKLPDNSDVALGWVGVGITSRVQNAQTKGSLSDAAGEPDWILWYVPPLSRKEPRLILRNSGTELAKIPYACPQFQDAPEINKIWFSADPRDRTIRARWDRPAGTGIVEVEWFRVAIASWPDFESTRPCVMLGGCATAVVRSAPTNSPSHFQEFVILTAARN
jgi:hypothetical protein